MNDDETVGARPLPPEVHQAEGMLSVLLGIPIEQAVFSLDLRAQFRGISLVEAARQIMEGHSESAGSVAAPEIGDRTLAILRQHLDCASSPLDQVN